MDLKIIEIFIGFYGVDVRESEVDLNKKKLKSKFYYLGQIVNYQNCSKTLFKTFKLK
jgi:hypothetical protein